MGQDWIEVTVRTAAEPAEVLSRLNDSTISGSWQDDDVLRLYWPSSVWGPDRVAALQTVLAQLGYPAADQAIATGSLADRNWNEPWARAVQPIRMGRVVIRPSWHRVEYQADDIELIIDPKQAFGTGHHATTQLLIEWLQEIITGGETVIDLGTGSGILAMVALRLGAGRAIGIDCDPVAIDCAREYAAQNGFGEELSWQIGMAACVCEQGAVAGDLLVANLDRQAILDSLQALAASAKRGMRLLLSGLLADQVLEIEQALASADLYIRTVRERDGWLALDVVAALSCDQTSNEPAR
ncbi:MAG: 50S ribosomal protein L11 methyltransferase [Nitrospiraceae bacterium]